MSRFQGCTNADGLYGLYRFDWSHEGYFLPSGYYAGEKDTIAACADQCKRDNKCVAFNYWSAKRCFLYNGVNSLDGKELHTGSKAYIKCDDGISFQMQNHLRK